jgi:1,4-dihydroxy-2-naphthoyl-CoA hydrolase
MAATGERKTNETITAELSRKALEGTFPGNLGIELLEVGDEVVRGRMHVDQRHLHPGGYVHGGAWVAFADTVAAWGTMRHLPPEKGFTTAELKMNVLGAGRPGDELLGVGELLHAGSRTQVWEVRVYKADAAARDGCGRLMASFTCTQMVL